MSRKDLAKARGLNSIADPSSFKGTSGRRRLTQVPDTEPASKSDDANHPPPTSPPPTTNATIQPPAEAAVTTLSERRPDPTPPPATGPSGPAASRRRRELSVPIELAEAVERTGVNPADVVLAGLRRYADAIYAGKGARMAARGRKRLRISISDAEFDQITRLGDYRGWNRSETVGVILSMELFGRLTYPTPLTEAAAESATDPA